MTLVGNLFPARNIEKESNYVDELSRNVENLRFGPFGPSSPSKGPYKNGDNNDANDSSFMSICSSPISEKPSPKHHTAFNKENAIPTTPNRKSVIAGLPRMTHPRNKFNSPERKKLDKEFFNKKNSPKTKRLVTLCQMYFLDYYCDLFDYVIGRRERIAQVQGALENVAEPQRSLHGKTMLAVREPFCVRRELNQETEISTL